MIKALKLYSLFLLVALAFADTAIVTYHLYKQYDSLTTVSCSDGANGIMAWGYKDISKLFPYVTAWQPASWNSPQCGNCAKITWNGKFTYVTVIDQCGIINTAYSHFDMSKEAFTGLFGSEGIAKGTMTANFSMVASKYCPGNKKGVQSATPQLPQYQQGSSGQLVNQDQQQNPLWVRGAGFTETNLNFQNNQGLGDIQNDDSQQGNLNTQWVQGDNSGSNLQTEDIPMTQYGGYSYDLQNQRNEGNKY